VKIGVVVDYAGGFAQAAAEVPALEAAGIDLVAVPEAYSFDAVSQLGYFAAVTDRVTLMSSVMQLLTRSPSLTAMTAAGLDHVSGGRFVLGLGASGPQVIEGFHGVRYDAPLAKTREVVEICRQVWRREPVVHRGRHYQVPLTSEDGGSGLGKALKMIATPQRSDIPVSIAALGPRNVELVAEIAQGWQPLFFDPSRADEVWGESLARGQAKRDPALGPLGIQLQVRFALGHVGAEQILAVRRWIALYVGGMGAKEHNFYHQLACRYGFEAEAGEVQELYLAGRKDDAARAVPDDLVSAVALVGDEANLRRRLHAYAGAGVTHLVLAPMATAADDRLAQVARLVALANEESSDRSLARARDSR
jgi:F420-dependent oxidoreductase-like protein